MGLTLSERERENEEAEREQERRSTWLAENPPTFNLRSGTSADEGVLRTVAVNKYNDVLSEALREKKITWINAENFRDQISNLSYR